MKTKELTEVPGYKGQKIIVKKLSYGDHCDLTDQVAEIDVTSSGQKVGISVGKMRLYRVAMAVVEAPFLVVNNKKINNVNEKAEIIRSLTRETGDYLYEETERFEKEIPSDVEKK